MATQRKHRLAFRFLVEIPGIGSAAFKKASKIKQKTEVAEIREGGASVPKKYPTTSSFENVTLERGASKDRDLYDWVQLVRQAIEDSGEDLPTDYEKEIDYIQLGRKNAIELERHTLFGAFPCGWETGDFDNDSKEVRVESAEICFQDYKLIFSNL